MRSRVILAVVAAACTALGLGVTTAFGHHANSAFDRESSVTVSGVVTMWQFINPHSGLWLEVADENGNVQVWAGEFQGTLDLYRHFSWNKDTFKPGDRVTLTGYPARDGSSTMGARIVIFADGTEVDVRSAPD
jgi:hypothetical protein